MIAPSRFAANLLAAGLLLAPLPALVEGAHAAEQGAEPTVAELLERIEALEKALEEVRDRPCPSDCPVESEATTPSSEPPAPVVDARPTDDDDLARPTPAPMPIPPSSIGPPRTSTAGYDSKDGFFVRSADGDYKLALEGYLQADSRFFADSGTSDLVDEFVVRRARLDLRAKFARLYGFRMNTELSGGSPEIKDGYLRANFAPWLKMKAGQFQTPFGIERQQGAPDLPFLERGLPDNLIPDRDIGLQLGGRLADRRIRYDLAVVNGVPDGDDETSDINDSVDVVARVFVSPYSNNMFSILRGLGFGVAASYGKDQGNDSDERLPAYRSAGRATFFEYEKSGDDTIADGQHVRVSPQATWFEGPFGLLTEYVWSGQDISRDDERAWINNQAWQVRTQYVLTGEPASMDVVDPHRPFRLDGGGHWGAWAVALRWGSIDVDQKAFRRGFADIEEAARRADALGTAITWYLNRHLLIRLQYEHTMFEGGAEGGDRDTEDAIQTRMQVSF